MTHDADARARSTRAGFSRRDFLKASGALVVSFSAAATASALALAQGQFDTRAVAGRPAAARFLDRDRRRRQRHGLHRQVRARAGHLHRADAARRRGAVGAARSRHADSVRHRRSRPIRARRRAASRTRRTSTTRNLALAAATAREALLRLAVGAARRAGRSARRSPTASISAQGDRVEARRPTASSSAGRKFNLAARPRARSGSRRASGRCSARRCRASTCRRWRPASSSSCTTCACPGMLHGAVVRPPAVGATLVSVDESSVRDMPGVVKVVVEEQLRRRRRREAVAGDAGGERAEGDLDARAPGCRAQREFYDYLRKQPSRDTLVVDSKDVDETLAKAATVVKATYLHPYQMHGSIGTSCAVADVQGGKATIWSPTQSAYPTRSGVGDAARRCRPRTCASIFTRGSGCYGINGADTVSYDAALLSQAVGQAGARAALAQGRDGVGELRLRRTSSISASASSADGTIVAWDYEAWFAVARRPARLRHAGQRRHRHAGRASRPRRSRRAAPAQPAGGVQQRQQRGAVVCRRAASAARAAAPARSRASAS